MLQRRTLELTARTRRRGILQQALPPLVGTNATNFFYIAKVYTRLDNHSA